MARPRNKHQKKKVLLTITEVIYNDFKDFCDDKDLYFSNEVEKYMYEILKKYYGQTYEPYQE